jgi:sporulation protein YlmC with PRC-barrel domain
MLIPGLPENYSAGTELRGAQIMPHEHLGVVSNVENNISTRCARILCVIQTILYGGGTGERDESVACPKASARSVVEWDCVSRGAD